MTEDTLDTVELAESLSMAILVLVERLGPVEQTASRGVLVSQLPARPVEPSRLLRVAQRGT